MQTKPNKSACIFKMKQKINFTRCLNNPKAQKKKFTLLKSILIKRGNFGTQIKLLKYSVQCSYK